MRGGGAVGTYRSAEQPRLYHRDLASSGIGQVMVVRAGPVQIAKPHGDQVETFEGGFDLAGFQGWH